MAALDFVDRYVSTVASGYSSGGTSLSVSVAPSGVSGACNFYLIVQAEGANTEEVFQVTNISGTTLTVVGAQAGTTASNHGAGAIVIGSIMTKAAFTQFKSDAAAAAAFVLLEQHTASTSAALNFTTCITSAYDDYMVRISDVIPASGAVDFQFQVSTDGGSTYDSSASYYYGIAYTPNTGGSGVIQGNNATSLGIFTSIDNTVSNAGISGTMNIYSPGNASSRKPFTWQIVPSQSGAMYVANGAGVWNANTAVNAFRFKFSAGNIASGIIRVYGLSK